MLLAALRTVALLVAISAQVCYSRQLLPSLSIQKCGTDAPVTLEGISRSNGSSPYPARTTISLCWTADNLVLAYYNEDCSVQRNDFLECNSPMYTQVTVHLDAAFKGLLERQCKSSRVGMSL
jgi:hypothetical protein